MKKKMLRNIAVAALPLLAAALFAGCTTIRELPPEEVKKQGDTPEFVLGRDMLIAFLRGDAKGYASQLAPEYQKQFNAAKFKQTRDAFIRDRGEPVSFRYLTTLEMPIFRPNVWALRLKRVNPVSKKEFYHEELCVIETFKIDDKTHVRSFNFR